MNHVAENTIIIFKSSDSVRRKWTGSIGNKSKHNGAYPDKAIILAKKATFSHDKLISLL
jgi:hypothetical protein